MQRRFHSIHHLLSALPVLEAAARLKSFTRAGEELGLTQPTVSRHIMNLEAHFAVRLFERRHNRLVLTAAGQQLADAVALGLGHIDTVAQGIGGDAGKTGITLACSFGFAHQWLLPRFTNLRRALGDYPLHLVTSDWLVGLELDAIDIIVSWTQKGRPDRRRLPLFAEIVCPVCSPAQLDTYRELANGGDDPRVLLDVPLLHFDERDSEFLNWPKWFALHGVTYQMGGDRYLFSNYQFMVQAMLEGEGVGLGWRYLIDEPMAEGRLIQVGPAVKHRDAAYYLEYREGGAPDEKMDIVLNWFREQAARSAS
jgi:LysR family glycine cleavage system transcriptional activator